MMANAFDILLGFAGISVLYKLQIAGVQLPVQVSLTRVNWMTSGF